LHPCFISLSARYQQFFVWVFTLTRDAEKAKEVALPLKQIYIKNYNGN
jgi:hypothetical protein